MTETSIKFLKFVFHVTLGKLAELGEKLKNAHDSYVAFYQEASKPYPGCTEILKVHGSVRLHLAVGPKNEKGEMSVGRQNDDNVEQLGTLGSDNAVCHNASQMDEIQSEDVAEDLAADGGVDVTASEIVHDARVSEVGVSGSEVDTRGSNAGEGLVRECGTIRDADAPSFAVFSECLDSQHEVKAATECDEGFSFATPASEDIISCTPTWGAIVTYVRDQCHVEEEEFPQECTIDAEFGIAAQPLRVVTVEEAVAYAAATNAINVGGFEWVADVDQYNTPLTRKAGRKKKPAAALKSPYLQRLVNLPRTASSSLPITTSKVWECFFDSNMDDL